MCNKVEGNISPINYYKGTKLLKTNKLETIQLCKWYIYKYLPLSINIIHNISFI